MAGLKRGYARLRTIPVAGMLASRAVWAFKGALGRPVALRPHAVHVPPAAAPAPRSGPAGVDTRLKVALAAVEALTERLVTLEPPPPVKVPAFPAASDAAPQSASVIVSTLDRAPWLDRALTALALQRHPTFEVIVVVGPCRDGTAQVLETHAGRIRVAMCSVANLSASRNEGLRLARGDIVAFLDDDAVPEPDWLERLMPPYADPRVGGAGGFIRDHTGLAHQCKVIVADRFGGSREVGALRRARLDPPGPAVERYLSLTGTNSSFRRTALLDIGGFDQAYAYFLDETDVCLRLAEAGWRLTVVTDAEVHHAYAASAQRRADRAPVSLAASVRSTAYFAWRNAAPRHGAEAVAEHLEVYADGLRHDTAWRCDHGVITPEEANTLVAEIGAALAEGVRMAAAYPRRLMSPAPEPTVDSAHGFSLPSVFRPGVDRLRLCLLSQDYPSDEPGARPCGGIGVWTHALATAMAAEGHEVTVVTRARSAPPSAGFEVADGSGVWVHRIPGLAASRPLRRSGMTAGLPASVADSAIAAAQEVARIAPRRQFDVMMGPLWDLEAAALIGGSWPVVVSLHTACAQMTAFKPDWTDAYRRSHVDKVIAGERRLLADAPNVLANSRAAVSDIAMALDVPDLTRRAVVIPHGLPDLARGVTPASRGGGVDLLFVGRMELRKGVDILLGAAPTVLQARPEARLILVGEAVADDEPWREAFLRRHRGASWLKRVRFEGPLPREDLLARYAASDLVVVPSRYESFGLTALEAMIFAKPCVASDAGGLGEVVSHGETGLLVPPGDPAALAAALLRLVSDTDLRLTMGAAGRRCYEARFTAADMARRAEAWFSSLLNDRHRLAAE